MIRRTSRPIWTPKPAASRRVFSRRVSWLAVLVLVLTSSGAFAQGPWLSDEVRFDSGEPRKQRASTAAFAPGGHGAVLWQEAYTGVVARFLDEDGQPVGEPVLLAENDAVTVPFEGRVTEHVAPQAVFLDDDRLLVAWTREKVQLRVAIFIEHRKTVEQDVMAQLFDRRGVALTQPYLLSESRDGFQKDPVLARFDDGRAMAAWSVADGPDSGGAIEVRPINRGGHPSALPLRLADSTEAARRPALAVSGDSAVIAWDACCDRGGERDIVARQLRQDGPGLAPSGASIRINSTTEGSQSRATVVDEPGEGFLIAWQGPTGEIDAATGWGVWRIYGQVVDFDGFLRGPELLLSNGPGRAHDRAVLQSLGGDHRVLVWRYFLKHQPSGLAYSVVGPAGATGPAAALNDERILEQPAAVGSAGGGRALATWIGLHDRQRVVTGRYLDLDGD